MEKGVIRTLLQMADKPPTAVPRIEVANPRVHSSAPSMVRGRMFTPKVVYKWWSPPPPSFNHDGVAGTRISGNSRPTRPHSPNPARGSVLGGQSADPGRRTEFTRNELRIAHCGGSMTGCSHVTTA